MVMLGEGEILHMLQGDGVFIRGHFCLNGGEHSAMYIAKKKLFDNNCATGPKLCIDIAQRFRDSSIEVVIGAESGAIPISKLVAKYLNANPTFAYKKTGGGFFITDNDRELLAGKRILVVEDVITTGKTVCEVIALAQAAGANVVGVGAICSRSRNPEIYYYINTIPFRPLLHMLTDDRNSYVS
jgi:orotate phosphoribosyltransferase